MYIRCSECGNETFRITLDRRAVCAECGKEFEVCAERIPRPPHKPPEVPEPPEPLPPRKPEKYWFE
ncbi:MAG TPA: hypothetical protein EYP30_09685 [Archaeoglobaceae archaeon]|nr:hypothetical protein [Archaeoglobaceae archaeon]